jgi:predicted double-glycine peptidase
MALHPHALENRVLETEAARSAKYRRWWWLSLVVAIVLGVYAGTLAWVTKRVEAGVERSIQPLPVVMQDRQHDAG